MRVMNSEEYQEWSGAIDFEGETTDERARPQISERFDDWVIVASEGMVGVYPEADYGAGMYLSNGIETRDDVLAMAKRIEESDGTPAAFLALGLLFEGKD